MGVIDDALLLEALFLMMVIYDGIVDVLHDPRWFMINAILIEKYGATEWIRTPDLCLRRATLYPAELRPHASLKGHKEYIHSLLGLCKEWLSFFAIKAERGGIFYGKGWNTSFTRGR